MILLNVYNKVLKNDLLNACSIEKHYLCTEFSLTIGFGFYWLAIKG